MERFGRILNASVESRFNSIHNEIGLGVAAASTARVVECKAKEVLIPLRGNKPVRKPPDIRGRYERSAQAGASPELRKGLDRGMDRSRGHGLDRPTRGPHLRRASVLRHLAQQHPAVPQMTAELR